MKHKCVVRLTTECWYSNGKLNVNKVLRRMARKSDGVDVLGLEMDALGVSDAAHNIDNLYQVGDGLFTLEYTNTQINRETSIADDYQLTLRPYDDKDASS